MRVRFDKHPRHRSILKNSPPLRYVGGSTWVVRKKVTDLTFRITKQSAALKKKNNKEKEKRKIGKEKKRKINKKKNRKQIEKEKG